MIDLQERKKQLTEEVARCTADIEQLQMALQRAMQARERLLGGLQLLNELLQPSVSVTTVPPVGPQPAPSTTTAPTLPTNNVSDIDNPAQ